MMQFTTISGMYTPSAAERLGRYACIKNCTTVTRDATITIYAGIRTPFGITFRNAEIKRFERIRTTVVDNPIPNPFIADEVTASVGHIPSISTNVGFSFMIPLYKRSTYLFICAHLR